MTVLSRVHFIQDLAGIFPHTFLSPLPPFQVLADYRHTVSTGIQIPFLNNSTHYTAACITAAVPSTDAGRELRPSELEPKMPSRIIVDCMASLMIIADTGSVQGDLSSTDHVGSTD